MPAVIAAILDARSFYFIARVALTFVFWSAGLGKLAAFDANAAMMESFGLTPGWAFNAVVLVLQIGASLLIIFNRQVWLATGALAVFTLLTIPIALPFWSKTGEAAFRDMVTAFEHISLIGGLALAAILAKRG